MPPSRRACAGTRKLPGSLISTRAELMASPMMRPAAAACAAPFSAVTTVTSERKKRGSGRLLWMPPSKLAIVRPSPRTSTRSAGVHRAGLDVEPRHAAPALLAGEAHRGARHPTQPLGAEFRAGPRAHEHHAGRGPAARHDRRRERLQRPGCELAAGERHAQAVADGGIELGDGGGGVVLGHRHHHHVGVNRLGGNAQDVNAGNFVGDRHGRRVSGAE